MDYSRDNLSIKHSQNEIANRKLIERLINQSSIINGDLVYDIGVGSGTISMALLKKGAKVIAIEKDSEKYLKCKNKFVGQYRFELYFDDFLIWEFPLDEKYKVFSNIPFFHTAEIINKLLFGKNQPEDCYLIVQKEAAEKYAGIPKESLISLLIKPVFWVDIIYHFRRDDFHPVPSVDITLLQFEKRRCRLVPTKYYSLYKDLIVFIREGVSHSIKQSLKQLFAYSQLKQLSRLLNIDNQANPADLNFTQYLGIFQFYLDNNLRDRDLILGAERKLRKQQADLPKTYRTITRRMSGY